MDRLAGSRTQRRERRKEKLPSSTRRQTHRKERRAVKDEARRDRGVGVAW